MGAMILIKHWQPRAGNPTGLSHGQGGHLQRFHWGLFIVYNTLRKVKFSQLMRDRVCESSLRDV